MKVKISNKHNNLQVIISNECMYYKSHTITDLGSRMKYQKSYDTSSSLIYSSCIITHYVSHSLRSNKANEINTSIEVGWAKGCYINLNVSGSDITELDVSDIVLLAISYTLSMFNPGRQLSSEEEKKIGEVLKKKEDYDIMSS